MESIDKKERPRIFQQIRDLLKQVKQIEYDFEHWNQNESIKKARILMQSPLYKDLPIIAKLILYYYQLSYILYFFVYDPGPEFVNLLHQFDKDFDSIRIHDTKELLFFYIIKIRILLYKNECEKAKLLEAPCLALVSELESVNSLNNEAKKYIALFYYIFSDILLRTRHYTEEFNYLLKSFKLWTELDDHYNRFFCIIGIMAHYNRNGEKKKSLQFLEENYNYFNNEHTKPIYAREILIYMSECSADLKTTLKHIEKAFVGLSSPQSQEEEKEPILYSKIHGYFVKGATLILMGDIEGSIEACWKAVESIKLMQQLSFNQISALYSLVLSNLGQAIAESGDLELSLKYQIEALNERLKLYNSKLGHLFSPIHRLANSYYKLIQLELKLEQPEDANRYLSKLKNLTEIEEVKNFIFNKSIINYYKLANGLIHKNNGTFEDIVQAKILLQEIINEDTNFGLIADAIVPLIDITIQQYKLFQNTKNYQEIVSLINRLKELGEKNNSVILRIYSLLLGGKIELINGNIGKAEELFRKSLSIAKEFKISYLIKKSNIELEGLLKDIGNWEDILKNTSIKERFQLLQLEDYIKQGQKYMLFNRSNDQ